MFVSGFFDPVAKDFFSVFAYASHDAFNLIDSPISTCVWVRVLAVVFFNIHLVIMLYS